MNQPRFLPRRGETGPDDLLTLQTLPSVDLLLSAAELQNVIATHGRALVKRAVQHSLARLRTSLTASDEARAAGTVTREQLMRMIDERIAHEARPSLRRAFNLTGTVIHTNLGRSPLPEAAIGALVTAARYPVNVEYDLASGERGERDDITEQLVCELTGAEAATVVNNNAAAVLLVLSALAAGREVPLSRGELIEIGGSFRMPDIMKMAGCTLVEVGTTNRTHLKDFSAAVNDKTALFTRIHTSNYEVVGFTASPTDAELAQCAKSHGVPLFVDLGSGALLPFERYGLPHETLPQETLKAGADIVSFSGDKLLGGPQAGIIVGKKALIDKIRKHPLKRALRCDKLIIGALEATLRLYRDLADEPQRLAQALPVLRLLNRPAEEIHALGQRLLPLMQRLLGAKAEVSLAATRSQIGSGSLPVDRIDSWALRITPAGKRSGLALQSLQAALRALPVPVVGRVHEGALWLDLRTLEDESGFAAQLDQLQLPEVSA